jgi:hypothetical protein
MRRKGGCGRSVKSGGSHLDVCIVGLSEEGMYKQSAVARQRRLISHSEPAIWKRRVERHDRILCLGQLMHAVCRVASLVEELAGATNRRRAGAGVGGNMSKLLS